MSPIKELPTLNWSKTAQEEMALTDPVELICQSDMAWRIGEVAVCGLIYNTFTSPPWMWFALAANVTMRDLIDFRRLSELIPKGTMVGIKTGAKIEIRFAKFYGFEPSGKTILQNDRTYEIFRRA